MALLPPDSHLIVTSDCYRRTRQFIDQFLSRMGVEATVVEVRAVDRPGLAWTIADTLARLGLDITFAKIATAKALALDHGAALARHGSYDPAGPEHRGVVVSGT